MESALIPLINKLAEYGPGFLIAGIFLVLYVLEQRKNKSLSEKLFELSLASLKADMEHTKAVASLEKSLDVLIGILKRD
jgi:hypothetical protein